MDLRTLDRLVCARFALRVGAAFSTLFVALFLIDGRFGEVNEWVLLGQMVGVYLVGLPIGAYAVGLGLERNLLSSFGGAILLGIFAAGPVYATGAVLFILPEFGFQAAISVGAIFTAIVGPIAGVLARSLWQKGGYS